MAVHIKINRREWRKRARLRAPRLFLDRSNPLEVLSDDDVFRRYRFRRDSITFLVGKLNLVCDTLRNCAIPPLLQLLLCLRFLATGSLHVLVGDSLNISRSTAGRWIRHVTDKICSLSKSYINFPKNDKVKQEFRAIAGFPNVIGCVDGTQIRIQRPTENSQDFVNRKGYHSLNVQMCCDARMRITSCNASWPGSVRDSRIFRNSTLCHLLETGQVNGYLLGDSGYPCRWFLMTPLVTTNSRSEERFNSSLCRTRVLIEQTFGVLKRRFQCLHIELRTTPEQAVKYVPACAVLHNVGVQRSDIFNVEETDLVGHQTAEFNIGPEVQQDGNSIRKHIVENYFAV